MPVHPVGQAVQCIRQLIVLGTTNLVILSLTLSTVIQSLSPFNVKMAYRNLLSPVGPFREGGNISAARVDSEA